MDQRVLVRVEQRPVPHGVADAGPPGEDVLAAQRRVRGLDGVAEGAVAVDDERGEQGVAPGEVAVERGRGPEAEFAGHRPQGERRRAVLGELAARDLLDVLGELDAGPLPCGEGLRSGGHGAILPAGENSGN